MTFELGGPWISAVETPWLSLSLSESEEQERAHRFVSCTDLKMRYVAAYLLATLGGNSSPSAKDIKKILSSVGVDADDERVSKVVSELGGKDLEGVINSGLSKLCSVPSGGAVAAAPASAAPAAGGAAAPEKKEEVKEESEESDEDMGFGLFD
ncbi:large ribosomal subunit protein P2-like [Eleutherodactylus coqui]|uniref:Large ribosomal subunit protein P2 n=1 Tax=Eleutherodactylus coqui TaxID=57060 RepID=A0A8J6JKM4_ELECQ|nr:hypothetical protein GDO78_014635 [Eleutherodactylus coqui]